jgi:hypothetical protein
MHGFIPERNTEECMRVEVINDMFIKNFAENQKEVLQNVGFRFFKVRGICVSMINGYLDKLDLVLEILNMSSEEIEATGCQSLSKSYNLTSHEEFIHQMKGVCKAKQYKEFFMRPIFNQFKKKAEFYAVFIEEIEKMLEILKNEGDNRSFEDLSLLLKY